MSSKKAIEKLVHCLAERSKELQQACATNTALRMRGAAIDVLARVQGEVVGIRARLGLGPTVPFNGLSHEQPVDSSDTSCCGGDVELLAPDIHGWLLQHLPWLARGLDMADVSEEDMKRFQQMDITTARTTWQSLVASLLQASGHQEEAFAAARRICQFWTSMVVFNPLLSMEFQGAQLLTGQPAIGGGEAPRQHWESVVRATKLTKLQAMLVVEIQKLCSEQLERINVERSELGRLIEAETQTAGRLTDGELSDAPLSALMDSLQHIVQKQQTVIIVAALSCRAVMTTQQFGRMMALAFPYPCSLVWVCDVLAQFIAKEPNVFHPEEAAMV